MPISEKVSGFRANFAQLRNNMNLSRVAFGNRLGVSADKIKHVESGRQRADHELLTALREKLGVDINALLSRDGVGQIVPQSNDRERRNGFVPIPRYSVDASAGHGADVDDEMVEGTYAFNRTWLERRGLKPKSLSVVSVYGDSMEPDLADGDLILIDSAATQLMDGSIYAVRFSDELYVKRIQHLPGKRMHLISSNKSYPPIEVKHPEADGVRVIGRIVASMHEW